MRVCVCVCVCVCLYVCTCHTHIHTNTHTQACARGPLTQSPLIAFTMDISSVETDVDSTPAAMRAAANKLLMTLLKEAGSQLVQPMMKVEIAVPEDFVGGVLADITAARHGQVRDVVTTGQGLAARHVILAEIPLATLLGYSTALRSITSGEGNFSMEYSHHAQADVQAALLHHDE